MADGSLWNNPSAVRQLLQRSFSIGVPTLSGGVNENREPPIDENIPEAGEIHATSSVGDRSDDEEDLAGYLLLLSPRQNFAWTGAVMTIDLNYTDFALADNRIRLIADGPTSRLALCKRLFADALVDPETAEPVLILRCLVQAQAHLPRVQRELSKIAKSNYRLTESFIESAVHVRSALTAPGAQDMVEAFYQFSSEHGKRARLHIEPASYSRFCRLLMRLSISWVSFICDSCDPTDRKTFRWTVSALRFAHEVTEDQNILQLEPEEFSLLRKSVASLVSLLISHFDILGARSSMEAKKEAEKVEAMRRLQRLQENYDDDLNPRALSPSGRTQWPADRSIRLVREERLRLINELEAARVGLSIDQHLLGQVLDEQVSEDRALVFLAASASNIALRWQQGQFIGGGANGNVYIGFNLDSGGVMAVKEIRVQDLSNSPALYKQIKDESDVMSMLSHPNIVEYFGIEVSPLFLPIGLC
jgi:mitogen-activated protein kinase kinase kinase